MYHKKLHPNRFKKVIIKTATIEMKIKQISQNGLFNDHEHYTKIPQLLDLFFFLLLFSYYNFSMQEKASNTSLLLLIHLY